MAPVAVEALVPESVAASVTAVVSGTEIEVPDCPSPESEVVVVVEGGVTVSTSPLESHVLIDAALFVSPE
jgi:hypothetical protein